MKPKNNYIAGKGHNEILEIVNPMGHTTIANVTIRSDKSENGGT
jgi:hypothetical protein